MPLGRQADRHPRRQQGVSSIEYALVAALIAMAIVAAVTNLGDALQLLYNQIVAAFPSIP